MSTVNDRSTYSGLYSGLANNAVFAVSIAGVGLTVFECLRRVRAHTYRPDVKTTRLGGPLGSRETWEFGYFYMARSWSIEPQPPVLQAAPLSWIIPTILYPEHKLPALTRSLDSVVHVRYLTAAVWFVLLHVCTSLPILLPIHLIFNPPDVHEASMNKASLQYLVTSDRFLWVHVVILYWLVGTWIVALMWLTRGSLRYRHAMIIDTYLDASVKPPPMGQEQLRGRRHRTVMIENIPAHMRSEAALAAYFEKYLVKSTLRAAYLQRGWAGWYGVIRNQLVKDLDNMPVDEEAQGLGEAMVEDVVLARKTTELAALVEQREVILRKLEALHVKLAANVLAAVAWGLSIKEHAAYGGATTEKHLQQPGALGAVQTEAGLERLIEALGPFVKAFEREKTAAPPLPIEGETVWEALYRLPPELLHPYQPLIRMKPRYSRRMDVAIDYYSLKLATISKQIDDERAIDEAKREPSTNAFVTFSAPHYARKAFRFLAFNPRSPDTCLVTPAPDPSDIIWKRAMRPNFRGVFLRDLLVSIGIWTFTLLWVPPVTIIVGLFSIQNLASIFPPLKNYFNANPAKESLVSSFLPTLLYSILVILIPPLLLFITNHGHSAITASKIKDLVLTRYWKFLVCNAVFFFSLGVTTISSFVNVFRQPLSLLPTIAGAFPTAAPFFVGWFVFETGMHVGLAISLMGFPIWLYPFHRAAATLRKRQEATKPRTYDFSYWLPTHMLVLLIMHVFTILNPLVIPFCFIYLSFEIIMVKHQKMHVFSHGFETNGFNINHRILRYSLDGLVLAQVIFLVLMILVKKVGEAVLTGLLILATIATKLYLSRKCKAAYAAEDKLEGDLLCATRSGTLSPEDIDRFNSSEVDNYRRAQPLRERFKQLSKREAWIKLWGMLPFEIESAHPEIPLPIPRPRVMPPVKPDADPHEAAPPAVSAPTTDETTFTQGQYAQALARPADEKQPESQSPTSPAPADIEPIITSHAPTSLWDDSVRYDATYANPLYSCPLENFMWLPRNPTARLDLDDGVNCHVVLLSRTDGGWRGVGRMPKEIEAQLFGDGSEGRTSDETRLGDGDGDMADTRKSLTHEPLLRPRESVRKTHGKTDEEIELPPIIAARVHHPEEETEIEDVEGPSFQDRIRPALSRARSSASRASRRISLHRASPHEGRSPALELDDVLHTASTTKQPVSGLPDTASVHSVDTPAYRGGEHLATINSNEEPPPTLSSFRALANVVLREARQEREEREKKEKKESESKIRRGSFAQILDSHGRVQ
ncbi:DUF221-domain-containing protein [Calocera cornea HHB12733]|uniref:DUF221-domain-containing protein n=1 Tax=Calocera cornea HHB12733 TaxID=1353952 RepID=A0A165CVY9_9BASI|nr:DUF221-domain-containing protein [Calocera cornea HHB12733]